MLKKYKITTYIKYIIFLVSKNLSKTLLNKIIKFNLRLIFKNVIFFNIYRHIEANLFIRIYVSLAAMP